MNTLKTAFFLSFSILCLCSLPGIAQPKAAPETLRADFVMTRRVSALKTDLKSEGKLLMGGSGLLRWETLSPAKSTLIIHKDHGWIHYPELGMTKGFDLSMDPVMKVMSEHLSLLTAGRFENAKTQYDVSPEKDGLRTLTPKSPEIQKLFKEMRVRVDANGTVQEVTLISANGDSTVIAFRNIEPNAKIDPQLFEAPKAR